MAYFCFPSSSPWIYSVLAVKIPVVDFWVNNSERCFVGSGVSLFNALCLKNQSSGFTEIGIDSGLLSVPKSHL